ncbi:MAG: ribonuclease PH [Anaerolineales bacterium]|nr:ribonuclease PH [Anaerolineales bacterium]
MSRKDGRAVNQLRPVSIMPDYVEFPEGSVLISVGKTRVLCNVSVENKVPTWMDQEGSTRGWITAEYALLPRSTSTRVQRETRGLSGRTQEIKRIIGRSLRAAFDLDLLGGRTLIVDCDVLQADGGTRTAAITGGYAALSIAIQKLVGENEIPAEVFLSPVAAISVGLVEEQAVLDLDYSEDSRAEADLNIVMNLDGEYIEIQGTGEGATFSRDTLDELLDIAAKGIQDLFEIQQPWHYSGME